MARPGRWSRAQGSHLPLGGNVPGGEGDLVTTPMTGWTSVRYGGEGGTPGRFLEADSPDLHSQRSKGVVQVKKAPGSKKSQGETHAFG